MPKGKSGHLFRGNRETVAKFLGEQEKRDNIEEQRT